MKNKIGRYVRNLDMIISNRNYLILELILNLSSARLIASDKDYKSL